MDSLIHGCREAAVHGIGDQGGPSLADQFQGAVCRGVVDNDHLGAGGHGGVQAGADLRGGVVGYDYDSHFAHVSRKYTFQ